MLLETMLMIYDKEQDNDDDDEDNDDDNCNHGADGCDYVDNDDDEDDDDDDEEEDEDDDDDDGDDDGGRWCVVGFPVTRAPPQGLRAPGHFPEHSSIKEYLRV